MKIKVWLSIIIICTAVATVYLFITSNKQTAKVTNSLQSNTTPKTDNWNIPELSKDFTWETQRVSKDSNESSDFKVLWDKRNTNSKERGTLPVSGIIYKVGASDSDPMYKNLRSYLREQYEQKLTETGWTSGIEIGDTYYMGAAADGVFASIRGFVKTENGKLRTIVYSYNLNVAEWEGPQSGMKCPCTLDVKVFVSDEVAI